MTEENIRRNKPPAFEQLFNRDLFLLKLMGLSSMNGILSNQKPIKKWWDGIPIFISIIIMTTIVICEFQTMCQIFQQQLAYAIQLFSVICSGALSISKSTRLWMYRMELYELLQKIRMMWKSAQFSSTLTEKISKAAERSKEITAGNWDEVTKNIAHLITLAIQTVIFCSFANTLTETSTQIGEAIYHSRWTDCNQKLKMMLLIIMIRAQKEFKYTAYVMGMGSMDGILSNDKLNTRWWESIFIFSMIIALDTIEMFQVNTIYQIFDAQLTYAIQLFGLTCSGVLSTIKIIRLWTYRLELYDLLQNLRVMWEFAQTQNYITKKIANIAERTRVLNMYYTFILGTGIIEYITHPYMCILKYQLYKDINSTYDFTNFVLPVAYWFSIDSYSTYFICITHQQLAVFITVISWAASDTLFAQLTTHVLANELKETINNSDHLDNDRGMVKKLGNIAAKYQQLFVYDLIVE
ncbi:hypothetical protein PV328_008801 [Microctonus aethiopoides]|uniref:Odorant receptor n=1 Tax=Microctonus aethiopoides TaxID=144406 RepID=A0AA39FKD2_9HYME|nr:hypothetical protein PV328_008801 [Microctonus aethiopoides]